MDTPAIPTSHVKRRKRRWLWVLLGVLAIFLVFAIDLAWAGLHAVDSFQQARDGLTAGGDFLQSGEAAAARNEFASAEGAGESASDALGHPAISAVGWLPLLGDDVDAARRGAEAIVLASQGGTAYADAAEAAGWDGVTLPGFAPGGHIDAAAIERAAPGVTQAADLLAQADTELAPVDADSLQAPLDRLMQEAKDEIHSRSEQATTAANLAKLLPAMLGADGARTYLLVTLSPSDPRGSGGYPGVFGLLHVDGHKLSLSDLAPTSEIPKVKSVPGPSDAKEAWGWAGIDRIFWDTTYTPDFPTAAGFMKGIWEAGGGRSVDGVIAGDPALMASLLRVVGPVDTSAWPETITSDNVGRIVGRDVYRTLDGAQSNAWEVGIGAALWNAVLARPWPAQEMATAASTAIQGQHLQVWSVRTEEQGVLRTLAATGEFQTPTATTPTVTLNGFSANRAGYFAATNVSSESGVDGQNRPITTVSVTVSNRAPKGPPSLLLGVTPDDVGGKSLGTFATDVNVYLPTTAVVTSFRLNGREVTPFEWNELGAHGVSWPAFIEPGKSVTIALSYRPTAG